MLQCDDNLIECQLISHHDHAYGNKNLAGQG
jgi:hypothetical protein